MNHISDILDRIEVNGNGCWTWMGARTAAGYGEANMNGHVVLIHRIVYERIRGAIPWHTELDHLCRNRACCNPYHLEAVSHRENILRGQSPPALLARKTHCQAGHEFTPEATITVNGNRECRECKKLRDHDYRVRRFGIRGNAQSRKTHCPHGHEYSEQNTYRHNGRRHCRACIKNRTMRRRGTRVEDAARN